jgi:hypothetical protein
VPGRRLVAEVHVVHVRELAVRAVRIVAERREIVDHGRQAPVVDFDVAHEVEVDEIFGPLVGGIAGHAPVPARARGLGV